MRPVVKKSIILRSSPIHKEISQIICLTNIQLGIESEWSNKQ